MAITSSHNDKLKQIRKLQQQRRWRERSGRFVAEGEDLLAAADAAGWPALERYCTSGSGLEGVEVEPRLLAAVSALGSGTRALAVYEERWAPEPLGPLCIYLHGVHDPGNVGAILRSAHAFGASCVALGPGSADPFGPKAVRASMGAVFAVPLARAHDIDELPGERVALVAAVSPGPGAGTGPGGPADAGAGVPLAELWRSGSEGWNQNAKERAREPAGDAGGPVGGASEPAGHAGGPVGGASGPAGDITILIGAEREGLPDEVIAQADHVAHIPIQTDSLNAAMAATVALYEVTRMAG